MRSLFEELAPAVRSRLPDARDVPIRVTLANDPMSAGHDSLAWTTRAALSTSGDVREVTLHVNWQHAPLPERRFTLAHELVHCYVPRTDWPAAFEEALADVIAASVVPEYRAAIAAQHRVAAVGAADLDSLGRRHAAWVQLDAERRLRSRALAWRVAQKVGEERYAELLARSELVALQDAARELFYEPSAP